MSKQNFNFFYVSSAGQLVVFGVVLTANERNLSIFSTSIRSKYLVLSLFVYFLGGLECDGHSFAYVAHFVFLEMSGFEPRELL
jgi:hypothetical protein